MDLWNSGALGLVESEGMVTALRVADIAMKTSSVSIAGFEKIGSGMVTVSFTGDIDSVRCAIDEIKRECQRLQVPVATTVLGRPVVPIEMLSRALSTDLKHAVVPRGRGSSTPSPPRQET